MSFGTPHQTTPATYIAYFNYANSIPIRVMVDDTLFDPEDMSDAFQFVVDTLANAGLTIAYAQKNYQMTEDCTPTP